MEIFIKNLADFLKNILGSEFMSVLLVSMLPLVEVRGGIPLGLTLSMSPVASYFSACLAGIIIVPLLLLFLKKILDYMCKSNKFGKLGRSLNNYFQAKALKIEQQSKESIKQSYAIKYLCLFMFVAIPVPLTGFWTGSAIAVFLNLNLMKSFLTITAGNLVSGLLVLLLSLALGDKKYIILVTLMVIIPIALIITVMKLKSKSKPAVSTDGNNVNDK